MGTCGESVVIDLKREGWKGKQRKEEDWEGVGYGSGLGYG